MNLVGYVAIIHDFVHITVPKFDCGHTRLCPGIIVPMYIRAPTRIVARHDHAVDIYNYVHKIMRRLYWCQHKYSKVYLATIYEM